MGFAVNRDPQCGAFRKLYFSNNTKRADFIKSKVLHHFALRSILFFYRPVVVIWLIRAGTTPPAWLQFSSDCKLYSDTNSSVWIIRKVLKIASVRFSAFVLAGSSTLLGCVQTKFALRLKPAGL